MLYCAGVRSCYDEGKRTAETLTMDYHRGAGVEVKPHFLNRDLNLTTCYLVGNKTFKNNRSSCRVKHVVSISLLGRGIELHTHQLRMSNLTSRNWSTVKFDFLTLSRVFIQNSELVITQYLLMERSH